MNAAVRYQSRGGNTRAVAKIIAEVLGVEAHSISEQLDGKIDLLVLGGGVYAWNADKELLEYLKHIDKTGIMKIAPFSTTGAMAVAIKRIQEGAAKAEIPITEQSLCLKIRLQGHAALGREGGHLTLEQIGTVREFAESLKEIS
jgi:flavodoxin